MHVDPGTQVVVQLPPWQTALQVAPSAQLMRQLPPSQFSVQVDPFSQVMSQLPPMQLSVQVPLAAQLSLQLPAAQPALAEADAEPLAEPELLEVSVGFDAAGAAAAGSGAGAGAGAAAGVLGEPVPGPECTTQPATVSKQPAKTKRRCEMFMGLIFDGKDQAPIQEPSRLARNRLSYWQR